MMGIVRKILRCGGEARRLSQELDAAANRAKVAVRNATAHREQVERNLQEILAGLRAGGDARGERP